ncbi:MAG: hypothetical protein AAFY66_05900 [Pseudomonadota bacterium]
MRYSIRGGALSITAALMLVASSAAQDDDNSGSTTSTTGDDEGALVIVVTKKERRGDTVRCTYCGDITVSSRPSGMPRSVLIEIEKRASRKDKELLDTCAQIMNTINEKQFLYGLYSNYAGPPGLSREEFVQRRDGFFDVLQAEIEEALAYWQESGCNSLLGDDLPKELGAHAATQGAGTL